MYQTKDWYIEDNGQLHADHIISHIRDCLPDINEISYDCGFSRHITNKKRTKDVCVSMLAQRVVLNPDRIQDVIKFLK